MGYLPLRNSMCLWDTQLIDYQIAGERGSHLESCYLERPWEMVTCGTALPTT